MWRAVVSQPLDRTCNLPELGALDKELGEFWTGNAFVMPRNGDNLSAYERNRLFLNRGQEEAFLDASFASGADIDSDSRSVIAADFDRDGRTDLLVGSVGGGPLRLFLNRYQSAAARVLIHFQDADGRAIESGCRVILKTDQGGIVRDLFMVNSCLAQSPGELLVGVGEVESVEECIIRWPDGEQQVFTDLPVNGRWLVKRGAGKVQFTPVAGWYVHGRGADGN
tara:strand:- start:9 stop:680 length:672 start_codon:yes stop_codon:yes gene_type:complete